MAAVLPVIGAIASLAGSLLTSFMSSGPEPDNSAFQQAQEENKKAANLQNDQANIEKQNKQIEALNQARRQRALLLTRATTAGAGDSSAAQGSSGSLITQGATAVATQEKVAQLESQRVTAVSNANMALNRYNQSVYEASQGTPQSRFFGGLSSALMGGFQKSLSSLFG